MKIYVYRFRSQGLFCSAYTPGETDYTEYLGTCCGTLNLAFRGRGPIKLDIAPDVAMSLEDIVAMGFLEKD